MKKTLRIVILHTEGCPSTPKTVELVRDCVSEKGLHVDLKEVLISSQEEADTWRFLGSPTVQIDGVDIDPAVRSDDRFGFT